MTFQTREGQPWDRDEWSFSTNAARGMGWEKTLLVTSSFQFSTVCPGNTYSIRLWRAFFWWFPTVQPRPSNFGASAASDAVEAAKTSNAPPIQFLLDDADLIVLSSCPRIPVRGCASPIGWRQRGIPESRVGRLSAGKCGPLSRGEKTPTSAVLPVRPAGQGGRTTP